MNKLLSHLLLAAVMVGCLTGCSSGLESIGLRVALTKLERKADGTALATLVISNPNVGSVNIAESSHQLTLNGRNAGTLKVTAPVGLPAQQTATVTATLAGAGSLASGSASYHLKSLIILRVIDDETEKYSTQADGSVTIE